MYITRYQIDGYVNKYTYQQTSVKIIKIFKQTKKTQANCTLAKCGMKQYQEKCSTRPNWPCLF